MQISFFQHVKELYQLTMYNEQWTIIDDQWIMNIINWKAVMKQPNV
jgi:hypothetical protein